MAHAKLPPSSASRWTVCTASVAFIEANAAILPKDSSVFADEGTLAHAYAAHLLGKGPKPTDPIPPEMEGHVRDYVEFVLSKKGPKTRLMIEQRVSLFYSPQEYGTVDATLIDPKSIYIPDLKYGAGVSIYAVRNKQLAIYAESKIRELEELEDIADDTLVTLAIFQPRDRNDPNPVRLWAISRKELREFCENEIAEPARKLLAKEKGVFVADPNVQCRFCPAKGICKHYGTHGLTAIPNASLEKRIELPDPASLTREQRVQICLSKKTLEQWLESVENQEVTELMAGAPRAGLKLVEGKTNRQWVNEEEADKLLSNYLPAEKRRKPWEVISVAQAEKALKGIETSTKFQNLFTSAVTKPPGKPSLVPEDDKRPALDFNPTEGMTKLATQEEEASVL